MARFAHPGSAEVVTDRPGELDLRPLKAALVARDELRLRRACAQYLAVLVGEVELLREERDRLEAEVQALREQVPPAGRAAGPPERADRG